MESRFKEAEALLVESKVLFIRANGENHGSTITADVNLAELAETRKDLVQAEKLWEIVIKYQTPANSKDDNISANSTMIRGVLEQALGKHGEARELALVQGCPAVLTN